MNPTGNMLGLLADSIKTDQAVDKPATRKILESIQSIMGDAIQVWQAGLKEDAENTVAYTPVTWLGPEKSRSLFNAHRSLRDYADQLTETTGISFSDSMGIVEQVDIVQPYALLADGEAGAARAHTAIESIQSRQSQIESFIQTNL